MIVFKAPPRGEVAVYSLNLSKWPPIRTSRKGKGTRKESLPATPTAGFRMMATSPDRLQARFSASLHKGFRPAFLPIPILKVARCLRRCCRRACLPWKRMTPSARARLPSWRECWPASGSLCREFPARLPRLFLPLRTPRMSWCLAHANMRSVPRCGAREHREKPSRLNRPARLV
jgi:hypothetical protein